ncbi:hypothetical protein G6F31_020073 [Rhizopus arrhizus]|nr:hypothetical protein G6F31_020073 [Rhizopus arrhizus]
MSAPQNLRVVLASRPVGRPKPSDFRFEHAPIPQPGDGQVLLETQYLSLDPYMRWRISAAKSYAPPIEIGGKATSAWRNPAGNIPRWLPARVCVAWTPPSRRHPPRWACWACRA